MPTDAELRALFRAAAPRDAELPGQTIDPATIIRRSRRRRLPQQLGAGSVLTLAVAGIGVAGFTGLRPLTAATTAESPTGSSATSMTDSPMGVSGGTPLLEGTSRHAPDQVNLCGAAVVEVAPSTSGLQLSLRFPQSAEAGADVRGTVTLTNTGTTTISGSVMTDPVVTVSQNGVTLWHSHGNPPGQMPVTLTPGSSVDYQTHITPVRCTTEDELTRSDLPLLPPGTYLLTAVSAFFPNDAPADLISGPAATIELK